MRLWCGSLSPWISINQQISEGRRGSKASIIMDRKPTRAWASSCSPWFLEFLDECTLYGVSGRTLDRWGRSTLNVLPTKTYVVSFNLTVVGLDNSDRSS